MHLLHMSEGCVLASAPVAYPGSCCCIRIDRHSDYYGVVWHPSSQGFLLSGCMLQLDAQPFQRAGLAVGWCSSPAHAGVGSAFSPSGDIFLASSPSGRRSRYANLSDERLEQYIAARVPLAILQCVQQPQEHGLQEYILSCLFTVETPASDNVLRGMWSPLPCGVEAVLLDDGEGVVLISPSGQPLGQRSPALYRLPEDPCIAHSPCGQFHAVVSAEPAYRSAPSLVMQCKTGKIFTLPGLCASSVNMGWHPSGSTLVLVSGCLIFGCPFSLLRSMTCDL